MEFNCHVHIIDMMPGAGKTSAAINYMKQTDEDEKILYITPYLDEVQRILNACPEKHFKEPKAIGNRGKMYDLKTLVNRENNIVATHALFHNFDREIIDMCRAKNYTLIMDEVSDVVCKYDITKDDFANILETYADIDEETGLIVWRESKKDYEDGGLFSDIKRLCDLKCLAYYSGEVMMWLFPVEAFNAFREVYILTYMFDAQVQRYYYNFYNLPYDYIYVSGNNVNNYEFYNGKIENQKSKYNLKELIHIFDDEKLNRIGDTEFALSKAWYKRNSKNIAMTQLKNNISNFFKNKRKTKTSDNLWTTFKDYKSQLKGQGYSNGFVPLNMRASNQYAHKTSVAYPVNRYMNTGIKNFFLKYDVDVDEDGYALSEMIQFIWRSAIRNGQEVWIYIPSVRMRNLLKQWITEVS